MSCESKKSRMNRKKWKNFLVADLAVASVHVRKQWGNPIPRIWRDLATTGLLPSLRHRWSVSLLGTHIRNRIGRSGMASIVIKIVLITRRYEWVYCEESADKDASPCGPLRGCGPAYRCRSVDPNRHHWKTRQCNVCTRSIVAAEMRCLENWIPSLVDSITSRAPPGYGPFKSNFQMSRMSCVFASMPLSILVDHLWCWMLAVVWSIIGSWCTVVR